MKYSFKIFSIFGIPVELHISFLVLILLIYIIALLNLVPYINILTAVLITLIFVSVVIHELAHCYMAKRYGIGIERIVLLPIGGISEMEEIPKDPSKELRIALAGPVSNLIIGGICYIILILSLAYISKTIQGAIYYFIVVNILLGFFNLLPAFPMDGGRILRAFLAERMNFISATKLSASIGKQLAIIMAIIGVFFNFLLILIAIYVYLGAEAEYQTVLLSSLLENDRIKDVMTTDVHTVQPNSTVQETLKIMFKERHMGYPVTDDGQLVGIVTFHDLSKIPEDERDTLIKDIMTKDLVVSNPEESLMVTLEKLNRHRIGRVPVVLENRLVGIVSKTDLTNILERKQSLLEKKGS
ncbi:MAG: CBS domain-containing protein [Methanobacterium sp.]|nr:CBS domain-containing protein [Methanobacterium sp.]